MCSKHFNSKWAFGAHLCGNPTGSTSPTENMYGHRLNSRPSYEEMHPKLTFPVSAEGNSDSNLLLSPNL